MTELVFIACLFILTLVTSNPVSQVFPPQQYASQQAPFKTSDSIPAPYLAPATQTNPYNQHATVGNQAPIQGNIDGTVINELLMNKLLKSPCLQKILDPNTKLYNGNGQEIPRINMDAVPSVVNNYFIVPPEFFDINNKTQEKSKNVPKRGKIAKSAKKSILPAPTTKVNASKDKTDTDISNITSISGQKNNNIRKADKLKKQRKKPAKIVLDDNEMDLEKDTKEQVKNTKTQKNTKLSINGDQLVEISPPNESSGEIIYKKQETKQPVVKSNKSKRGKSKRKNYNETETAVNFPEIIEIQENIPRKNRKLKSGIDAKNSKSVPELVDGSHLRDIVSPVDDYDTKDFLENQSSTKFVKENRKTRNPKEIKRINKQNQNMTPVPDDVLKNFFQYLYMTNNFYPNGLYPFNFEQFYQPYIRSDNKKSKSNKSNKNQNKQSNKEIKPKVVEIKLQPKKQTTTTTTVNPLIVKNTDEVKSESINKTTSTKPSEKGKADEGTVTKTESAENNIFTSVKEPHNEKLIETLQEEESIMESDPKPPKQKSAVKKANLEMPPTVIEDLHEYINHELGNEDIVPTLHSNGIISDYYPTFDDESHYIEDDSYNLKDLEDNRHLYTADREFEEPFNSDRRKYDRYEEYPRPNLENKDFRNFGRNYESREKGKTKFDDNDKSSTRTPYYEEKENMKDNFSSEEENVEQNHNKEDLSEAPLKFQVPPHLENPDFITTKIDNLHTKSDIQNHGLQTPIYTDSAEEVPEIETYFDPKPIQYSRLVNFDSDDKKNDKTINKPRSDCIETVFAKTRVVKYGVGKEVEKNPLFDHDGEDFYSDGHTTIILAKSLGHPDEYFW